MTRLNSPYQIKHVTRSLKGISNLYDGMIKPRSKIESYRNFYRQVRELLDLDCRSMKYNPIFTGIKENTIEKLKLVLVEFQRELENDDAFDLANVHRFGKGFKTRHVR